MQLFEYRGRRTISFKPPQANTPGDYAVIGCTVPHGAETHFDSECWTGGFAGSVGKEQVHTYDYPRDRNETLWTAFGPSGAIIPATGDAGGHYFHTREAAAKQVIRTGVETWRKSTAALRD